MRLRALVVTTALVLTGLGTLDASAAPGACGFSGDVNVFTAQGAASGDYNVAANWDAGHVPSNGQACIPVGKTALAGNDATQMPDDMHIQGTLQANGNNVRLGYRYQPVTVTGTVSAASGTSLHFGSYSDWNLNGGTIRAAGGIVAMDMAFHNNGGTVDLTGGGHLSIDGGSGTFSQGASSGDNPVQGKVIGGTVLMQGGTTVLATGTGSVDFEWAPNAQAIFATTLQANQSILAHCSTDGAQVRFNTDQTSYGRITLIPQATGDDCPSDLALQNGATLTNHGAIVLGDASLPTRQVHLTSDGTLINAADGTIQVLSVAYTQYQQVLNSGTVNVGAGALWFSANSVFEHRDGAITTAPTGRFVAAGNYSIFRELLGTTSGPAVELQGSRVELLGTGKSDFVVPKGMGAYLQAPNSSIVVHPNQTLTADDGNLATVGAVENRGLITLKGTDGQANFGTPGDVVTNHATIVLTSEPGQTGYNFFSTTLVNAPDGVVTKTVGSRNATLGYGNLTNQGLMEVWGSANVSANATFASGSTLRVYVSKTRSTRLDDLYNVSTLGGTLDVVTDASNPPVAGAPFTIVYGRSPQAGFYTNLQGSFDALQGSVSDSLGYALSYPTDAGRHASLQVVPAARAVTVTGVTAPSTAAVGDDATVTWSTTVSQATTASFTDTVLLSNGPAPDASSIVLGRVTHPSGAAANTPVASSISVRLPSQLGRRYLVVVADSGSAIAVGNRTGAVSSSPIDLTATGLAADGASHPVAVGADGTRTVGSTSAVLEGTRLLRLTGTDDDLSLSFSPPAAVSAVGATGRVPTEADNDGRSEGGVLRLVASADGSPRYVLLHNSSGAPVTVTVTAAVPGTSIADVSPPSVLAGAPASTPIHVTGAGFQPTSKAVLTCGASTVQPVSTVVDSRTSLTSVFALPSALGVCSVTVGSATKTNAFSVDAGSTSVDIARLTPRIHVIAPAGIRTGVDNRISVSWTNDTGYTLPAPLFQVMVDAGTIRFPGTAPNGSKRVDLLGIAPTGPAGLLAPGQTGSADLLVRGLLAHQSVHYFVGGIEPAQAFDLGLGLASFLGDGVPATARSWVQTHAAAVLGLPATMTVGDFQKHLGDVASNLSALGRRVPQVIRLQQADLARVTDGDRLDAFRTSELGVGQAGLNVPRLTVEQGTSDVLIAGSASRLRFAHQANGTYVSPPGDADLLTPVSGGWALVARDGLRRNYTSAGLLTSFVDSIGKTTQLTYSGTNLTKVTYPNGDSTTYDYDANGRVTKVTDPVGNAQTYGYDSSGRRTSAAARGVQSSATYDSDNLVLSVTDTSGVVTSFTRDSFGRVTRSDVGGSLSATYVYNADGSVTSTDALGHTTTTWRDDTGLVAKVVDAANRITTVRRNANGDPVGTDADGLHVGDTSVADSKNQVAATVDALGGSTAMTYDVDGLTASITDPLGHRTSFTRDAQLRTTAIKDPGGASTTLTYDANGRPSTLTDRSGRKVTYTYLASGQISQQAVTSGPTISYTYDSHRNLASATGPAGVTTYGYDSVNRISSVSYPNGLGATFGYDSVGRRTTTTTSDGRVTTLTYNSLNLPASVASQGAVVARYEYDALGRVTAVANANGTRTETTRDDLGRITEQKTTCCTANGATAGSTVVSDVQLTYDALDRVVTRTSGGDATAYEYDGNSRLTKATTTGTHPRTLTYSYDAVGNRTSVVDSAGGTTTSTFGADGRPTQTGPHAITHDAAGRRTAKGSDSYTYDAGGSLTAATVGGVATTYTYDATGTPLTRTTGAVTTKLLIDPSGLSDLLGEYTSAGELKSGYVWGDGLASRTDGATNSWYVTDVRGDVVALTGADGAVSDSYRYLPFGEVAEHTGSTTQPFGFSGRLGLRTESSGLVVTPARFYDPSEGRFLTEDPDRFTAANPYTWVSSDPLNRTDADGATESFLNRVYNHPSVFLSFGEEAGDANSNYANEAGYGVSACDAFVGRLAANEGKDALGLFQKALSNRAIAKGLGELDDLSSLAGGPGIVNGGLAKVQGSFLSNADKFEREGLESYKRYQGFNKTASKLQVFGGLLNAYQGYEAWKKDPSAWNAVRQTSKAFLKTVLPTPAALLFDTVEAAVDETSLSVFQYFAAVDPITAANTPDVPNSHWNAKHHLPFSPDGGSNATDSSDPNAIIGPNGVTVDGHRYVGALDRLPYTIQFENKATASLPAGQVVVTQPLDDDLDLSTFQLGTIGIGGQQWTAPQGSTAWSTLLDDRTQSGLMIRVKARLDVAGRSVRWELTGIDPDTGDAPADAKKGFLPPDVTAPQGQGFLTYDVAAPASGSAVTAKATIVFDANDPIDTNTDEVLLDRTAPTSAPTVPAEASNPVPVALGAADTGGSGVTAVDVFAAKDGGDYTRVGQDVAPGTFSFNGDPGHRYTFTSRATDAVGNVGALSRASIAVLVKEPTAAAGGFVPLVPTRLVDTRTKGSCVSGAGRTLQVAGVSGVPADAAAVALNVTAVTPKGHGYLIVYPAGAAKPTTSVINFEKGVVVANAVTSKVGQAGKVTFFASGGCPHLLVDVVGWYRGGAPAAGGFSPLVPTRLLDTRSHGSGPCVSGTGRTIQVAGLKGVPADAAAVSLNVTVVQPKGHGYLIAYPAGAAKPTTSVINYEKAFVVANAVTLKVGQGGKVTFFASGGCPHLLVDVVGWFAGGTPDAGGFAPLVPTRLLDTRAKGQGPCVTSRTLQVSGLKGVPADAAAVSLNVTAVTPTGHGYLIAYPAGAAKPTTSVINYEKGFVVPNAVTLKVGQGGKVTFFASGGCPHLLVDVVGWYAAVPS